MKHLSKWGWGVVLLTLLAGLRIVSDSLFDIRLPNRLQDLITLSSSVILESMPFVILGILISIAVQVYLPRNFIINHLPSWPPLRRLCISFLGMFFPVCECGNLPLARGLMVQGFTVAESLVFLLAAPILNPITIFTTYQAFAGDTHVVLFRVLGGFLIANIIGWLYSMHRSPQKLLTKEFAAQCKVTPSKLKKQQRGLDIFVHELNTIMPALFIGALLAGVIQVLVPREVLLTVGGNPIWSIAAMMVLAFVVSICSNVDAFFALAFKNTFTTGSLVSFMVFGPIIDIKMLALMRTTYRTAVLVQITIITALISALIGLVVNYAF